MERLVVRPPPGLRHLRLKVGLLLILVPLGIVALTLYAFHARGAFEPSRTLTLHAADADGVDVGMPLQFSGFPIGTVTSMGLSDEGRVWISVRLREKDARWLRTTSTFALVRPLVGGARIVVTSPRLADPPMPKDGTARLEVEDATRELPDIVAQVKGVLANVERLTAAESHLDRSLARLETVASRMAGDHGVLEGLTGRPETAQKVTDSLERIHALTVALNGVAKRMDRVLAHADDSVLGDRGVAGEAQRAMRALTANLADLQGSIRKLDATLENARNATADLAATSKSAKDATGDLHLLRAQVDDSLQKTQHLLTELNRKWPFARDASVKLP